MSSVVRIALSGGLALTGALLPASAALAEAPERTGWWNRLSAGTVVAPAPSTAEGDLRIGNAPDGPTAYSAVLYPGSGATDATLTLEVRSGRTLGSPEVSACLITSDTWEPGGNQPFATAPEYDCALGNAIGELAPDGSTLTFLLDATTQDATGAWSLALVPTPGSTAPFDLEVAEPEADAFVASPPDASSEEPFVSDPDDSFDAGTEPEQGDAFAPGGFGELPPSLGEGVTEQPLLAGGADAPLPETEAAGPEPAVAGGAAPGAAAAPVLLTQPAGVVEDLGTGRRLLALLVLAGGSAAVGYAAGQQQPGPRLIGGRSRIGAAPSTAGAAAVAVPAEERPRGIGRFAKQRTAAPRRLR